MYVDSCHITSALSLILFIAVRLDADGSICALAWAAFTTESTKTWSWFFYHLMRANPCMETTSRPLAILSGRQKGLTKAIVQEFGGARHYFCTQYLAANLDDKFGLVTMNSFKALAYQHNTQAFQNYLDHLEETEPALAE